MKKEYQSYMYLTFRVLVGLGFFLHGGQKLFGWFGGPGFSALSGNFMFAGIVELITGLLIVVGFFTSISAIFGAIVMIGAWVIVHGKEGINPLTNGGELAMIYFAAFLVLIAYGAGKWSLEKTMMKKELLH